MSATCTLASRATTALIPFLFVSIAPVAASTQSAPAGLTLKGAILRSDGAPLPGAAAYIYTAAVRRGTSPF